MSSFTNIVKSNIVAQAIVSIIVGLLLMFWPGLTIVTVLYLVGAIFVVMGASSLISYFREPANTRETGVLATGVFFLIIALIVFLFPQVIAGFFSLVLGILLVLCGVVNAVRSLELRAAGHTSWIVALVISAIIAIGGIVIIANPFATTSLFVFALGAIIFANGIVDLVIDRLTKKVQSAK